MDTTTHRKRVGIAVTAAILVVTCLYTFLGHQDRSLRADEPAATPTSTPFATDTVEPTDTGTPVPVATWPAIFWMKVVPTDFYDNLRGPLPTLPGEVPPPTP
jgi:hypothetical protein